MYLPIRYLSFSALVSLSLCCSPPNVAQKPRQPVKIWTVGPLSQSEPVMGISFGPRGGTYDGPHVDSQTGSIFAATRSVVFAGNRIVLASRTGMRRTEGAQAPSSVYQLLSLDSSTGKVKDSREFVAFGSLEVFATNDAHVIVSGRSLKRPTPGLKEVGNLEFAARGHKYGDVENMSPDGTTLGNQTSPGFELIDSRSLAVAELTPAPATATSVNSKGFVTDNPYGYTDAGGTREINHTDCGGRPQFLTDELVLETGCSKPVIVDLAGHVVKALPIKGGFSYAGVSPDGTRFALQDKLKSERFTIYSTKTWEPLFEVKPDLPSEGQSWTAFSPDGSMFIVGSPLKLTLYRIP